MDRLLYFKYFGGNKCLSASNRILKFDKPEPFAMSNNHPLRSILSCNFPIKVLVFLGLIAILGSCRPKAEIHLTGLYADSCACVFRYGKPGHYVFEQHTVWVVADFQHAAKPQFSIGAAGLDSAVLMRNRRELGRKLMMKSDFVVSGYLSQPICSADSMPVRAVSLQFDTVDNHLVGLLHLVHNGLRYPLIPDLELERR